MFIVNYKLKNLTLKILIFVLFHGLSFLHLEKKKQIQGSLY